jgi:hypothetical protein
MVSLAVTPMSVAGRLSEVHECMLAGPASNTGHRAPLCAEDLAGAAAADGAGGVLAAHCRGSYP